jgi:hypothetical protein
MRWEEGGLARPGGHIPSILHLLSHKSMWLRRPEISHHPLLAIAALRRVACDCLCPCGSMRLETLSELFAYSQRGARSRYM